MPELTRRLTEVSFRNGGDLIAAGKVNPGAGENVQMVINQTAR
ncbi:MAG: hypothetical protein ACLFWB_01070 [Armatimonadota bacterium]